MEERFTNSRGQSKPKKHNIKRANLKCDDCQKMYALRLDKIEPFQKVFEGKNLCKFCRAKEVKRQRNEIANPLAKPNGKFSPQNKPYFDVECANCAKIFEVHYTHRAARFCCKVCQTEGHSHISVKKTEKCVICGDATEFYGEKRFTCSSNLCISEHMSQQRFGENNPAWKEDKTVTKKCKFCEKEFTYGRGGLHEGQERFFCKKTCFNDYQRHINARSKFNSVSQHDPTEYIGWTKELATSIRERDDFSCVICGGKKKEGKDNLPVHHIDYNTNNQDHGNLVTLCTACHNRTNFNREFWQDVFASLKGSGKIVKKVWGLEGHITNNNKFCLKFLIFFKGGLLSLHAHNNKKELFFCLQGKMGVRLVKNGKEEKFLIKAGDKLMIEPGLFHQLEAFKNSIIVEVSTQDFKYDSYRLEPSQFNENNDANEIKYLDLRDETKDTGK